MWLRVEPNGEIVVGGSSDDYKRRLEELERPSEELERAEGEVDAATRTRDRLQSKLSTNEANVHSFIEALEASPTFVMEDATIEAVEVPDATTPQYVLKMKDGGASSSVEEWLEKHKTPNYDEVLKICAKAVRDLKEGRSVQLSELNNDIRKELQQRIFKAVDEMLGGLPPTTKIYYEITGNGKTRHPAYTVEEFKNIVLKSWKQKGFEINYDEETHYELTSGDRSYVCPIWVVDSFRIIVADRAHGPTGSFCMYRLKDEVDAAIKDYCYHRLQLADHVPRMPEDAELYEPCSIHSILCVHPGTEKQKEALRNNLYSRLLTRHLTLASMKYIAEEFMLDIYVFDIDGNLLKYFTGGTSTFVGTTFGNFGSKSKKTPAKTISLVLWDDHYIPYEKTPFNDWTSSQLIKQLQADGKLEKIVEREAKMYRLKLPRFIPAKLNNYSRSMFKSAQDILRNNNDQSLFSEPISDITLDNIDEHVGEIFEDNAATIAYNMFLNYLAKEHIDVFAMSGWPRDFVRQSCRGAIVSTAWNKSFKYDAPVTTIDMNSQYPYALSLIDLPLGMPSVIPDDMPWEEVLKLPCFVVETKITKYHVQHELDVPLHGMQVLNHIDFRYRSFDWDHEMKPRGYYWKNIAKQPLKPFVERLYEYKLRPDTKAIAKAMLNKLIGMFIKKTHSTYKKFCDPSWKPSNHPLVQDWWIEEKNGREMCCSLWMNDLDYNYNFPIVQSLVYSKAKELMNQVFNRLHNANVPLLYTSTDSITIPSDSVPVDLLHPTQLGKFKIEAEGSCGFFIDRGLYYINDSKYACSTVSREALQWYLDKNNMKPIDLYVQLLQGNALTFTTEDGRTHSIGKGAVQRLVRSKRSNVVVVQ